MFPYREFKSDFDGPLFDNNIPSDQQTSFDDFYHDQMKSHLGKMFGNDAAIRHLMQTNPQAINQIMCQQGDIERYLDQRASPVRRDETLSARWDVDFQKSALDIPW